MQVYLTIELTVHGEIVRHFVCVTLKFKPWSSEDLLHTSVNTWKVIETGKAFQISLKGKHL